MITFGRSIDNDVVVKAASVSKFHAYFMATPEGGTTITDTGSSLGSFVNERKLTPKAEHHPLRAGDAIRLGELRCTFHSPESFFVWLKALE